MVVMVLSSCRSRVSFGLWYPLSWRVILLPGRVLTSTVPQFAMKVFPRSFFIIVLSVFFVFLSLRSCCSVPAGFRGGPRRSRRSPRGCSPASGSLRLGLSGFAGYLLSQRISP